MGSADDLHNVFWLCNSQRLGTFRTGSDRLPDASPAPLRKLTRPVRATPEHGQLQSAMVVASMDDGELLLWKSRVAGPEMVLSGGSVPLAVRR